MSQIIKVLPGIREEQRLALPTGATVPATHLVDADGATLGTSSNPLHVHGSTGGGGSGNGLTNAELRASPVPVTDANTGTKLDTLVAQTDTVEATLVQVRDRLPTAVETRGSGAVDSNTTRVTLATDGPGVANLSAIASGIGAPADAAASSDTGTFGLVALVKRGLQNWTALLARIPALVSGRVPVDASGTTVSVAATARVCLGTERVTVPTTQATLQSLMTGGVFPAGTVVVELQADGGTVRLRRDGGTPTTTLGFRLDDGQVLVVDSSPTSVRVIAATATPLNVACFDRV